MKVTYELDLETFEAWGYAKEIINRINDYGITNDVMDILDECYNNLDETELNDIFSFDYKWILESLGIREQFDIEQDIQELKEELWELDEDEDEERILEIEDELSKLDDELEFWKD